jgi:hypothetical protein
MDGAVFVFGIRINEFRQSQRKKGYDRYALSVTTFLPGDRLVQCNLAECGRVRLSHYLPR